MYDKSLPFEATIKWIKKESRDTITYSLGINNKEIHSAYSFRPGQFNMLYIPGIGESPISISSSPSDHDLTHTVRIAGDVTTAISKLNEGDILGIRGPMGNGWPIEEIEDRNLIIIAGGLGIAPLRSVIRHMRAASKKSKTGSQDSTCGKGIILYGAKSPKDILFRDEFPGYRDTFEVQLTVDKADPEEYWRGEVGLITELINKVSFNPLTTVAFVCGPEVMMQAVTKELLLRGVPGEKIFITMERNMNCGIGICGHCFFGPKFTCKDGPVFRYTDIEEFFSIKEL